MEQRSDQQQNITRDLLGETRRLARYTRNWVHYGVIGFTLLCSLIAALRAAVGP